jgi:hypothetical protein
MAMPDDDPYPANPLGNAAKKPAGRFGLPPNRPVQCAEEFYHVVLVDELAHAARQEFERRHKSGRNYGGRH